MAFMKVQIETYLIDALRNGDTAHVCQAILCACACPADNITYMPQGLAACIAELTNANVRSIRRALLELETRRFLTKLDEFRCEINPSFMSKSSRRIRYKGEIQGNPNDKECEFLFDVHRVATEAWKARGKGFVKHTSEDDTMIKKLSKELKEVKDINLKMLSIMEKIAAGMPQAEVKEVVECHLKLIKGEKE